MGGFQEGEVVVTPKFVLKYRKSGGGWSFTAGISRLSPER
jgi:hypothetical protein